MPEITAVDDLLVFMSASRASKKLPNETTIGSFDGAYAILPDIATALVGERQIFPTFKGMADIGGRVDRAVVVTGKESMMSNNGDAVQLTRFRSASNKVVRGRVHGWRRYMATLSYAEISPTTGEHFSIMNYVGSNDGLQWETLGPTDRYKRSERIDDDFARAIKILVGIEYVRPLEWSVCLRFEGHIGVRFVTDPSGAREVFRLRDIPNGKTRRAALRHWVEEHARRKHNDPSALIDVRRHMRGSTEFNWNGLYCKIEPSRIDRLANLEQIPPEEDDDVVM